MAVAAVSSGLLVLLVLACPIGMGLMMWFMAKGMMRGKKHDEMMEGGRHANRSLAELKAEQARLAAKIDALEEGQPERTEPTRTGGRP